MTNSRLGAMWAAHVRTPFPPDARGVEVRGIDLVQLDSLAAGCISSLIDVPPGQDAAKATLLKELAPQVEVAVASLVGPSREYFSSFRNGWLRS